MSLSSDDTSSGWSEIPWTPQDLDFLQTLLKWFRPPHPEHFCPQAGHFSLFSGCSPPQNRDLPGFGGTFRSFFPSREGCLSFLPVRLQSLILCMLSSPEIAFNWVAVASSLLQISMHCLRVRLRTCRSFFLMVLLFTPRPIRSLIRVSRMQSQKLHDLTRLQRAVT